MKKEGTQQRSDQSFENSTADAPMDIANDKWYSSYNSLKFGDWMEKRKAKIPH